MNLSVSRTAIDDPQPEIDPTFAHDVRSGLGSAQKSLPSKYFYDARGSDLFEEICELDEYYPTRTEIALLGEIAADLAAAIPTGATLVEYGSGASVKTRALLDAAPHIGAYVPIDISPAALAEAVAALRSDYPDLPVRPLMADFIQAVELPRELRGAPRVGFFPGSTIGNFTPERATEFLAQARRFLGPDGAFILGADLVKDIAVLIAAYDDSQGVTARFNLNLLTRINRELGGDFDLDAFTHSARWNPDHQRIEMHLVSSRNQTATAAGHSYRFEAGETIHTENSHKFTEAKLDEMASQAGWRTARCWTATPHAFAVTLLEAV